MGRHYSNHHMKQVIKRNELADGFERSIDYVRTHLEQVIVVAVVLVLVAVVVPYWAHSRGERAQKAGQLLFEAQNVYANPAADEGGRGGYGGYSSAQEKYTQAQTRFREIASGYSGSSAAVVAELGVAQCDLRLNKLQQAGDGFQKFLASPGKHVLAPVAAAGLGYCLEAQGKAAEAAKAFAEAAARYPKAINLGGLYLDAARNYGLAGDAAKQAEALNKVLALSGQLPKEQIEEAQAHLKVLKGGKA